MNISEQIIEVINALCEKFGIAIDWTAENIMPYIEKLCGKFIDYEIHSSVFWICFMSALSLLLWIITAAFCSKAKKLDYPWDIDSPVTIAATAGIIFATIVSIIAIAVIGCQIYDIVEATTFPEKTIYDYVSGLIKKSSN